MKVFETPSKNETILVFPDRIEIAEKRLGIFKKTKAVHPMSLVSGVYLDLLSNSVTISVTVTVFGRKMTQEYEYAAVDARGLYDAILPNME